ncbi:MAG: tetratricopeptide repeat protein [Desulfobacteraceae bacterium]
MSQVLKQGFTFGLMLLLIFVFMPYSVAREKEEKKEEKLSTQARLAIFKAQTAMSEEKPDEALEILDKYIETQPRVVPFRVYELMAYIWMEKDDIEKAREYFKIMYDAQSDDPKILKNYAVLTYQTERYAEAAVLFEKLYEIEETTTPGGALPQAAQAFMLAEDLDNSKRVLERLIELPGKPDAKWYEALIGICLQREEDGDAERYIIDFLRLDPLQAAYWKNLAQIRMKRDEWQTATSDLEISHRVEAPGRQKDWIFLGDLYARAVNAPLMGVRCYRAAYRDNSDEKGYLSISRIYQTAYRYDEAIRTLDEGIRKNPMSATLLLAKGRVLYDARRYKEAITALKECVKIEPKSGDAYFQMGLAAWTAKEWDTARTAFVQAKRLSEKYSPQCDSVIGLLDELNEEKAEVEAAR